MDNKLLSLFSSCTDDGEFAKSLVKAYLYVCVCVRVCKNIKEELTWISQYMKDSFKECKTPLPTDIVHMCVCLWVTHM